MILNKIQTKYFYIKSFYIRIKSYNFTSSNKLKTIDMKDLDVKKDALKAKAITDLKVILSDIDPVLELIKNEINKRYPDINSMDIDHYLWTRSQDKKVDDKPYHLTRTIYY